MKGGAANAHLDAVLVVHHGALHREQRAKDEHLNLIEHVGCSFISVP